MINPWYGEEEAWHASVIQWSGSWLRSRGMEAAPRSATFIARWDSGSDVLSLEEGLRGLEPDQVRELKPLREENERLRKRVAELSLDKARLQNINRRKG